MIVLCDIFGTVGFQRGDFISTLKLKRVSTWIILRSWTEMEWNSPLEKQIAVLRLVSVIL